MFFLLLIVKCNVRHVFVYKIITSQALGTTFPEENVVCFKEESKVGKQKVLKLAWARCTLQLKNLTQIDYSSSGR